MPSQSQIATQLSTLETLFAGVAPIKLTNTPVRTALRDLLLAFDASVSPKDVTRTSLRTLFLSARPKGSAAETADRENAAAANSAGCASFAVPALAARFVAEREKLGLGDGGAEKGNERKRGEAIRNAIAAAVEEGAGGGEDVYVPAWVFGLDVTGEVLMSQ